MPRRLSVLALSTFAIGTGGFVIACMLPAIAEQFAVSVASAGLLVTIFAVTYALGSPLLATLTANVARRPLLLGVMALFAVANVLAALASSFTVLAAARVFAACAAALFTPIASAVVAAAAPPEQRGRALAVVTAGLTVATVVGVPIGTWIGVSFGWRSTFWLVAALAALAVVGMLTSLPTVPKPTPVALSERLALLRNLDLVLALVVTVLTLTGGFTMFTYIAPLLRELALVEGAALSAVLLAFGVGGVIGTVVGGYGADRWGPTPTLVASLAGQAALFLLFPLVATSLVGAAFTMLAWGTIAWTFQSPQQVRLLRLAPAAPGLALSFYASAIYLGIGLGSALGGVVLRSLPVASLGAAGGLFVLLALAVLLLGQRRSSRLPEDATAEEPYSQHVQPAVSAGE